MTPRIRLARRNASSQSRRAAQLVDDVLIARRRSLEQLQRDPLGPGTAPAQQPGCAGVGGGALGRGKAGAHGAGQDRVAEPQDGRVLQQPGSDEFGGGGAGVAHLEARECRGEVERRPVAQDRRRAGERGRPGPGAREGTGHRPGHGRRRDRYDASTRVGRERNVVGAKLTHELVQEERVAARGLLTRAREALVHRPEQLLHTFTVERQRLDPRRRRPELLEWRGRRVPGPNADQDGDWQRLEPAGQISKKPQRRLVRPPRVVDRQQHRQLVGEVDHEPVEAVEKPDRGRLDRLGNAEQHGLGQLRRTVQESLAVRADHRLEALSRHAQRIVALELRPHGVQHAQAPLRRALARRPHQRGFPDTGGSLDEGEPARPVARAVEQRVDRRELVLALHQALHGETVTTISTQCRKPSARVPA